MNWGKGIIGGMIGFVLFITIMGIYMWMSPTDDYDHQYYEKGLSFNHIYDREALVSKDHAQPVISIVGNNINLQFVQPAKGTVKFMRPSNTGMDKTFKLDGTSAQLPVQLVGTGQWELELSWTSNDKAYLYHQEIFIP